MLLICEAANITLNNMTIDETYRYSSKDVYHGEGAIFYVNFKSGKKR